MSNVDTALVLRMEASLAKFEKQMARARKAGTDTAKGLEERFANSNRKMAQSAEGSARVIGAEMDRLRTKYDPLYAASKQYEQSLDELNRAHKLGALGTKQHEAALEALNAEYARTASSANRAAVANGKVTATTRGMGGGIQNVAFQIGDFATQVGAGTAASVALGQQLPQLLGGFGALGAVLGAVVAIGVPLAAAFFRSGDAAEGLEDKADNLKSAVREYQSAAEDAMSSTADLASKYLVASDASREFLNTLQEITRVDALDALEASMDAIANRFGELAGKDSDVLRQTGMLVGRYMKRVEEGTQRPDVAKSIDIQRIIIANRAMAELASQFEITYEKAGLVASGLADLANAEGPEESDKAALRLLETLEATLGPYEDMNASAKELYRETRDAGEQARTLAGVADEVAASIGGAASEAGRLADELGRAVSNAINLAAQGVSDELRAKIEYEYRDDPIRKTKELATVQFNETVPRGLDGPLDAVIDKQREAFVSAAVGAEEYRQKLIAWRKAEATAAAETARSSGASKGRRGGGRSRKEEEPLFGASDREMLQAERQIEAIGKTRSEIVALEAKYRLLDEAKERGLNLDARYAGSSETLAQEIERQSQAIGSLSEQYEAASTKADFFAQQQADLRNGMLDVMLEGESLKGVLGGVAKAFARAAVEASLFNKGPLGSGSGSGLLGSLWGALTGRAAGGPVTAGRGYRINENSGSGSEPFFPAVSGRILSTAQAQQAMQGQGGQTVTVNYAPTIDARGADMAAIQRLEASQAQMKREIPTMVVKTLKNTGNRGATRRVVRK